MLIQLPRWLRQAELWRFVGFGSTIVGLSSYALSSSFTHLFGEWNLLNTILYSIFSLITAVTTLFAKVWRRSTSRLLFKAHMAVLVLTATSAYSFFYGKAVNGKPDAYILISCAAFSIMSLSLSRQTQCGFEIDLLYFFLGCLIVQLMQINSFLVTVGGSFSYCLIILRSSLDAPLENGYTGLQLQDQVVIQVDSLQANTNSGLQDQPRVPIQLDSNSRQASTDSSLIMSKFVACIEALKKKNRNLIRVLFTHLKDKDQSPMIKDALPPRIINNLHETVKLMMAAGFEEECCHVYISCRREFLEECVWKLGLRKLSIEDIDVHMRLSIEFRIRRWIKASNATLGILFPNERRLCDRVFEGFSSAADRSFTEVCREVTNHLLNFANAFPIPCHSPNLLCSNLKVLETLHDLIQRFESIFCDRYSVSLRNEAIAICKRLGEAIRGFFGELENLICHDPKAAAPSGGLHPVTRCVMNYLRAASRSRHTLEHVFELYQHRLKEYPKLDDDREPSSSSLSEQMDRIMELLESNLEAKPKIYKHPALRYVFLMNNSRYIVQKAEDSELRTLLGNDWIRRHIAKVRRYRIWYQRSAWKKVLCLLKQDDNLSWGLTDAEKSMKEKLKLFNMNFEEIYRVQSSWFVLDEQLREEIRISLENILVPAYENFISRFRSVLGNHADDYIKYGMEDIGTMLKDLFLGTKGSTGSRKRW
ncbi:hypothetical protein VNO77_32006 [Canavalia gladiata]|uniref:Exocyst subunit Exo70 family protein n=1 Tax=Canavalia gladiata TaxID=3824 RepID=A0AAN9Q208_CANGL